MAIGKGVGTTIAQGVTTIGKLTSINPGEKTWETADITTLDSSDEYKNAIPILKAGGEIAISGFLNVSDAGQIALDTAFEAGTLDAYTITYPSTIGADSNQVKLIFQMLYLSRLLLWWTANQTLVLRHLPELVILHSYKQMELQR